MSIVIVDKDSNKIDEVKIFGYNDGPKEIETHVSEKPLYDKISNIFDKIENQLTRIEDNLNTLPDIFISHTPEEGIKVYSTNPDLIGSILIFEAPNNTSTATSDTLYDTRPEEISGDIDDWYTALGRDRNDLKTFLENFIVSNS